MTQDEYEKLWAQVKRALDKLPDYRTARSQGLTPVWGRMPNQWDFEQKYGSYSMYSIDDVMIADIAIDWEGEPESSREFEFTKLPEELQDFLCREAAIGMCGNELPYTAYSDLVDMQKETLLEQHITRSVVENLLGIKKDDFEAWVTALGVEQWTGP